MYKSLGLLAGTALLTGGIIATMVPGNDTIQSFIPTPKSVPAPVAQKALDMAEKRMESTPYSDSVKAADIVIEQDLRMDDGVVTIPVSAVNFESDSVTAGQISGTHPVTLNDGTIIDVTVSPDQDVVVPGQRGSATITADLKGKSLTEVMPQINSILSQYAGTF